MPNLVQKNVKINVMTSNVNVWHCFSVSVFIARKNIGLRCLLHFGIYHVTQRLVVHNTPGRPRPLYTFGLVFNTVVLHNSVGNKTKSIYQESGLRPRPKL